MVSVTPPACQLPLAREPCGQCPQTISHGSFLLLATSLTRPVSLLWCRLGIDNRQQVPPHYETGNAPPAGSLSHLRCQLPPGGSLFCAAFGRGKNKCFSNKYRDNPYYIQKIRRNSNLSVIFAGGVVKTTKIGIEIVARFVYNYLIVVQGT